MRSPTPTPPLSPSSSDTTSNSDSLDPSGHSASDDELTHVAERFEDLLLLPEGVVKEPECVYAGNEKCDSLIVIDTSTNESVTLTSVAKNNTYKSDRRWQAKQTEKIPHSRRTYRAKLEMYVGLEKDVVLKFGSGFDDRDNLIKEANYYQNELEMVQESVIPKFYGLFGSTTEQEGTSRPRVITCLVLQYVGEPPSVELDKLPPEQRYGN